MVHDIADGFQSDRSLSDVGVAVFACAQFIFAVVDMNDRRIFLSN